MRRIQRTSARTKPRLGAWLDRAHWFSRGLRAFWLLNEGMGETARDLVGGLPATFSSSPFSVPSWTGGRFGSHAIQFAGSSYLLVGSPAAIDFTTGTGFTCIFAARCDTVPNFTTGQIANKGGEWSIDFEGPSVGLRYVLNGGGGAGGIVTESKAMAVGDYSIWAVTYNRTSKLACIYRDGSLRASATLSAFGDIPASSANLALGSAGGSTVWPGTIDFVAFWDYDLNGSQIQAIHAQPFLGLVTADSLMPWLEETSAGGTVSATASYGFTAAATLSMAPPATTISAAASYGYTAAAVLSMTVPNTAVTAAASYGYTAAAVIDSTVPGGTVVASASYGYTAAAVLSMAPPAGTVSASASYGFTAAAVLSMAPPASTVSASATYGFGAAAVLSMTSPAGSISASASYGFTAAAVIDSAASTAATVIATASYGFTAAAVIATATTIIDLTGALQNEFSRDSNLSAISNLWLDQVPAKETGTVATISYSGGSELLRSDETRVSERTCRFRVYASDADTATVQGQILADRVKAWGNLVWASGYAISLYERTRTDGAKVLAAPVGVKPRYYFEVTMIARVFETL